MQAASFFASLPRITARSRAAIEITKIVNHPS
jgi:hypothetical protein